MAPRSEEQFEAIRESRKAAILDAALHVFAEEGYHSASISRIAKKANISKGLMYNYFLSKESLLREVIYHGTISLMMALTKDEHPIETKADFSSMIHRSFDAITGHLNYWKLYFAIVTQPVVGQMLEKDFRDLTTPWLQVMEHYFRLKGVKDPALEAFFLESTMDGMAINYVMDPGNFPLEEIKEMIISKYS